jgi:hypothetical protein
MRCLCYQWECGGVPAEDTVRLARIVGTSVDETTPLWDVISIKFEKRGDGLYWNRRLESVRSGNSTWVDQKRAAGKARAAKAQRGQRGQFTPCKTSKAVTPVTPSTSAAGDSAGGSAGASAGQSAGGKRAKSFSNFARHPADDQRSTSTSRSIRTFEPYEYFRGTCLFPRSWCTELRTAACRPRSCASGTQTRPCTGAIRRRELRRGAEARAHAHR